jgi:hypothetical protein
VRQCRHKGQAASGLYAAVSAAAPSSHRASPHAMDAPRALRHGCTEGVGDPLHEDELEGAVREDAHVLRDPAPPEDERTVGADRLGRNREHAPRLLARHHLRA